MELWALVQLLLLLAGAVRGQKDELSSEEERKALMLKVRESSTPPPLNPYERGACPCLLGDSGSWCPDQGAFSRSALNRADSQTQFEGCLPNATGCLKSGSCFWWLGKFWKLSS